VSFRDTLIGMSLAELSDLLNEHRGALKEGEHDQSGSAAGLSTGMAVTG
jgi:hypothetical protein